MRRSSRRAEERAHKIIRFIEKKLHCYPVSWSVLVSGDVTNSIAIIAVKLRGNFHIPICQIILIAFHSRSAPFSHQISAPVPFHIKFFYYLPFWVRLARLASFRLRLSEILDRKLVHVKIAVFNVN